VFSAQAQLDVNIGGSRCHRPQANLLAYCEQTGPLGLKDMPLGREVIAALKKLRIIQKDSRRGAGAKCSEKKLRWP